MSILELLIVVLLVMWLIGAFVVPIGGSLIHALLVICVIVIVIRLVQGRPVP